MKRFKFFAVVMLMVMSSIVGVYATGDSENSETRDSALVQDQQAHFSKVHPLPYYDFSIPRDVYGQIYDVVTQRAYVTYTVITSMTGEVFYKGPSIGYAIPADTSLTNPVQMISKYWSGSRYSNVVEQAEPNGLFSSKNTDGTWVLFLQSNGDVAPVYTELKVTTFPYPVDQSNDGIWGRTDNEPIEFTVTVGK